MTPEYLHQNPFKLGEFIVNPNASELTIGSEVVQLQPKVMQVLLCLAANHGQIVKKERLLEEVWPDTYVVEGSLRRCIFLLRKNLVNAEDQSEYLETIPKQGYRLLYEPLALENDESTSAITKNPSPKVEQAYVGLRVFEHDNANIFFGRSEAISLTVEALKKQDRSGKGFVLVLGSSGCGKSSLVRAGVSPALKRQFTDDGKSLSTVYFQLSETTATPTRYMAQKISEATTETTEVNELTDQLEQLFESDIAKSIEIINERLSEETDKSKNLLIVFDQFEEIFSLKSLTEDQRTTMIELLYALARSGAISIIATMRSEFYPNFMSYQSLRYLRKPNGQVDLSFPSASDIAEIVRRPAQLAGFTFEADSNHRRLDQQIIDDAIAQKNSLPLLQFALRELELKATSKKVIKIAQYKNLGNFEGCLSSYAERTYKSAPSKSQASLPALLEKLIIADPRNSGRVLKRTALLEELEEIENSEGLIETFINAHLLTTFLDKSNQKPAVRIAHEAILQQWDRVKEWTQRNYTEIRFRHWLAELSQNWSEDNRASHYLLPEGKPLMEAKRLSQRAHVLTDTDIQFVRASEKRSQQLGWIKRGVTSALVLLSGLSIFFGINALKKSQEAQRASNISKATTDFLVANFEAADPGNTKGQSLTALEMLQHARGNIEHLTRKDPEVRAAVMAVIAESYAKIGQLDEAEEVLGSAEQLVKQLENNNPKLTGQILLELAGINRQRFRYQEARDYAKHAQKLLNQIDEPYISALAFNLSGLIETDLKNHTIAMNYYDRALYEIARADRDTARTIKLEATISNNKGMSLYQTNALSLADETFQLSKSILEQYELQTTREYSGTLGHLGTVRRLQNNPSAAIEFYDQSVGLMTRLYGPYHRSIFNDLANKVSAELALERYDDAIKTTLRALDIASHQDWDDPNGTAILHNKHLIALHLGNRPITAQLVSLARDSLSQLIETYGDEHPFVIQCKTTLEQASLTLARP